MVNKVTKHVFEIIESVSKAPKRADKIAILQQHQNVWALKDLLRGNYDDRVQWNLPKGSVPYTPAEERSVPSNFMKQNVKFKYFVKGGVGDQMPSVKRERIFLDMIETIHPKDAELVIAMVNKNLKIKGLTKKLVEEAFPGLILT